MHIISLIDNATFFKLKCGYISCQLFLVMPSLEKLLVAMDGSDSSIRAAEYAIEIAKNRNWKVIALYVVVSERGQDFPSGMIVPVTPSSLSELIGRSQKLAQEWSRSIEVKASAANVQLTVDVVATPLSVVPAILDYAEKNRASIIIVGSSSRSGIAKRILGSVASGVVNNASCPVMVVK
jgi:nucleotide-binding universal stress UspA family protein